VTFSNPPPAAIQRLLATSKIIAVVGLSDNPARPSHDVSQSMRGFGYRILPVNPALTSWEGQPAYPNLAAAAAALAPHERIDIVNVFRRPARVGDVVDECLRLGLSALWLQLGVVNEAAAERARDGGMTVVMDRCIYVDRARMPV
jgi:predicted CoA-binding protein